MKYSPSSMQASNNAIVRSVGGGRGEPLFKIFCGPFFSVGKFFGPPKYFILFFSNILETCGRGFAYLVILAFQKLYKDYIIFT